jgi:hypothetical protein
MAPDHLGKLYWNTSISRLKMEFFNNLEKNAFLTFNIVVINREIIIWD